jgi:hypothetical protein
VKLTIELPDNLFRMANAAAARRGMPLRQLIEEALEEKLARERDATPAGAMKWPVPPPEGIDPADAALIDAAIEEAFEQIEPEDHDCPNFLP